MSDTMRDKVREALKEWDILPKDRPFSLPEVNDWLVRFVAPAMEAMRAALSSPGQGGLVADSRMAAERIVTGWQTSDSKRFTDYLAAELERWYEARIHAEAQESDSSPAALRSQLDGKGDGR